MRPTPVPLTAICGLISRIPVPMRPISPLRCPR
jgi:hypothetical protein